MVSLAPTNYFTTAPCTLLVSQCSTRQSHISSISSLSLWTLNYDFDPGNDPVALLDFKIKTPSPISYFHLASQKILLVHLTSKLHALIIIVPLPLSLNSSLSFLLSFLPPPIIQVFLSVLPSPIRKIQPTALRLHMIESWFSGSHPMTIHTHSSNALFSSSQLMLVTYPPRHAGWLAAPLPPPLGWYVIHS